MKRVNDRPYVVCVDSSLFGPQEYAHPTMEAATKQVELLKRRGYHSKKIRIETRRKQ